MASVGLLVMGSIRLLLAVAVVFEHCYGTAFSGGVFAVQLFFVVSGFFISYILIEAQTYNSVRSFYKNRALRLFPAYWVVALASLAMYVGGAYLAGNPPPFLEVYQNIDTAGRTALVLSNIFLFGQDWIIFSAVNDGVFHLTEDYHQSDFWVWRGLLVPPAWSLGVELTFYLIAPFILPRLKLLVVLLGMSVLLRIWLISIGLGLQDPWSYRFFPTELALFILGALSHQLWMPYVTTKSWMSSRNTATVSIIMISLIFFLVTLSLVHIRIILLLVFVLSLPFLFAFQKNRSWDQWLGELSYPIYICHWSVIFPVSYVWDRYSGEFGYQGLDETAVVLILTVAAALVLKKFVVDPVENLRDRVRQTPKVLLIREVGKLLFNCGFSGRFGLKLVI